MKNTVGQEADVALVGDVMNVTIYEFDPKRKKRVP
jgi:hypothetical protein